MELQVIEKYVKSWRRTDKHNCPKCDKKLGMKTEYVCTDFNADSSANS